MRSLFSFSPEHSDDGYASTSTKSRNLEHLSNPKLFCVGVVAPTSSQIMSSAINLLSIDHTKRSLCSQDRRQISTTVFPRSDWIRPLWDIRALPTFQHISMRSTGASGATTWLLPRRNPWYRQPWEHFVNYNVLYLLGKFNKVIKMREFRINLPQIDSEWPSLLGES